MFKMSLDEVICVLLIQEIDISKHFYVSLRFSKKPLADISSNMA